MEVDDVLLAEKRDQNRKCENCENDYKYRCPACNTKSCSLECVNHHKSKTGCDGDGMKKHIGRNIAISQYNCDDMWRDFNFLEEMRRRILNASRYQEKEKHIESQIIQQNFGLISSLRGRIGEHKGRIKMNEEQKLVTVIKETSKVPKHSPIPLLKKACSIRKMKIHFCPINEMEIRKNNTTYYNKKDDLILWKMEFNIYQDNNLIEKKYLDNISENEIVIEIILKLLVNLDKNNIKQVLLLNNFKGENNKAFQEINLNKNFKENLIGKNIVEFPRFRVEIHKS
ncbi:HIT zinc finger family protein [Cryptosporidium meleagridis]|uniref:HIT zinc finger family protein n=1 Tax=Cryptosporidium meleagridis TaxID=93969 RepID=A0A2P4Z4Z0_9CRYT|nr:HIT zinc finger family protein [Cryptosporidium meleagridis]